MGQPKKKVLFLCTGNSCRSQMAEGWTKKLLGNQVEPWSAGTNPKPIDPRAIEVMAEVDVDIRHQEPKHVRDVQHVRFDAVVTVCDHARENCPVFPSEARMLHFGFDDPPRLAADAATEEQALAHYRRVRDEIRDCIKHLPAHLA